MKKKIWTVPDNGSASVEEAGRAVLITGSNGDFGSATVREFARAGWRVVAAMREPRTRNQESARALEAEFPGKVRAVPLDVTNGRSVSAAVKNVIRHEGRIDVLVNNAGRWLWGPFEAQTMQQAKELFETNLFGVVRVTQAVLPVMREQGSGLIVYISSGLGRVVRPGIALYAATKFAGEAIAQTLRYELAPFGIDSVIVEPGAFDTGLFERSKTEMEWPEIAAEYSKFLVRGAKYGRETDVTLVSGAILEVAQTPRGKRPMRTAVGMPAVLVREYNKQHAIAQEALLTAAGTADEILTNGY